MALTLPGGIYFALRSRVWGGGVAFYDASRVGSWTAARAYLLTRDQFRDVWAQETHRWPKAASDLDVDEVVRVGRQRVGTERYGTVLLVGEAAGVPMLTFTASWRAEHVGLEAPSAGYLRMLAGGLVQAHGWDAERISRYLLAVPGMAPVWDADSISVLVEKAVAECAGPMADTEPAW